MQTYIGLFFAQFILIIIITILLILIGFGANLLIEAQTAKTSTDTGSSPTQSLNITDSTFPVPGKMSSKIDCADLATRDFSRIPDAETKIMYATLVTSSTNSPPTCKITGTTAPNAMFIIELPVNNWNGDYFQGGCGGLCGLLREPAECTTALGRGAAIGYSDLGHQSSSLNDASWALPENSRIDFAHHANHALALVAKQIINTYYGQEPRYSYFIGCSDGGREGLMEAQRYPDDFHGIVTGAPAAILSPLNYFKHSWDAQINLDSRGKSILDVNKLPVLHNAVMKTCDSLDGATDGLLLEPRVCTFDPTTLQCPNDIDAPNCLTKEQIAVVNKIYSGPVDDRGNYYYPGGQVYGSELGWIDWVVSPSGDNLTLGKSIADAFVGYMSMPLDKQGTNLGALDVNFTQQAFDSIRAMANVYDATNPDMSKFQAYGGKLILYHGFSDPSIVPTGTLAYYAVMVKQMGELDATQNFARLFMFPGVYHCGGGYGPSHFDMVTAISAWVEHGIAPDKIMAIQYSSDGGQEVGATSNDGPKPKSGKQTTGQILPTGGGSNSTSGKVIRTLPAYPILWCPSSLVRVM